MAVDQVPDIWDVTVMQSTSCSGGAAKNAERKSPALGWELVGSCCAWASIR